MSKAQDMQNESVVALRGWLDYLDEQEVDLRGQLERLRRKEKPLAPDEEKELDEGGDVNPDNWM
jgi:hypothetical protein